MTGFLAIFQFTSLAMLGWLAAALAPLLIHLFTRKRFRKVTWAAMEYLLAAMKKNQRRIQLEQWVLLAVRTLLLVVLALALADPVLSQMNVLSFGGTTPPTHYIFVVDATYSMDLQRNGVTRFQAAKDSVREIVQRSTQGDGFSLVLLADPPRVVVGEPAFDQEDLLEELNAAPMTHGLGHFEATLTEVEAIAASARKQHGRLALTRTVFLADLERSTWEAATTDAAQARLKKLAKTGSLSLVDLGSDEVRNAAVVHAEIADAPVTIDRQFTVEAKLEGYGEGRTGKVVTLLVDGEAISQQTVPLDSAGHGAVAFQHRFASPGDHTIEIRLAEDALGVDNRRWLSVPVREALRVLCIDGRPGESRFVALALEPDRSPAARVRVEQLPDTALLEKDLSAYDAIFLVNLPQLDSEQALVLQSYVKAGGGLVVFPGDQTRPGEFLPPAQSSLLPATFTSLSSPGDYHFVPLEYRHELVAAFRGFEKAGLLTTPVSKYVRLEPASREDVNVAMSFDTGDPAVVEGRFGQGRVILFATAASPDSFDRSVSPPTRWTELPTWPSFPPLVQESLALVARSREEGRNRLVGEPLSSLIRTALPNTLVSMRPPSATEQTTGRIRSSDDRQVQLQSEVDAWRWVFGDTFVSGIYTLTIGQPADRIERFAVNLEPRESGLQRVDAQRLPQQLEQRDELGASSAAASGSPTAVHAWFRSLLVGVLVLLVAESFLARWFGGGRA